MKEIILNHKKISITIIDNGLKDTLICIHGVFSSKEFIDKIKNNIKSFNVIAISYAVPESMNIETFLKIFDELINKRIKHTKMHILAHSYGGLITSFLGLSHKIKSIYFVNPIHPFIYESKNFKLLKLAINPQSKIAEFSSAIINSTIKGTKKVLPSYFTKYLDKTNSWNKTIKNDLMNEELIVNKLDQNFKTIKFKSKFLISEEDKIISEKWIKIYLKSIKKDFYTIPFKGHTPFIEKDDFVVKILNKNKKRKRFFIFKNIIK